MKILGIIPSRYGSSRFPGKPLADISGKSMIRRVYEQAARSAQLDGLFVATDDQRIFEHVKSFGGQVVMTSAVHPNGTSRCLEALGIIQERIDPEPYSGVVNIQGDEPFIQPDQISDVAMMLREKHAEIATLCCKIDDHEELFSPHVVKVVFDKQHVAGYFSRQVIPYCRDKEEKDWLSQHDYYKHIGIYGFHANVLAQIGTLKESPLEKAEQLEQLRWLENGFKIHIGITTYQSPAIDTPEDLSKLTNIH
jgi:3-deoxy-manno-octulosonate cytidylyltransferase (CMP-KDO synthetase)